jgi:hypothetical protein
MRTVFRLAGSQIVRRLIVAIALGIVTNAAIVAYVVWIGGLRISRTQEWIHPEKSWIAKSHHGPGSTIVRIFNPARMNEKWRDEFAPWRAWWTDSRPWPRAWRELRVVDWRGWFDDGVEVGAQSGIFSDQTEVWGIGWPSVCVRRIQPLRGVTTGGMDDPFVVLNLPPPPPFALVKPPSDGLRPWWAGMAANTIVFSAAWSVLLIVPPVVRALLRSWTGRCPKCGYLMHELPSRRCPECGWERRARDP